MMTLRIQMVNIRGFVRRMSNCHNNGTCRHFHKKGAKIIMNTTLMKISTIGSSQAVADELYRVVSIYFGHKVEMKNRYSIKEMPAVLNDDLYIALPTRVEEASKYVKREQIFPLELIPEDMLYIRLARVPAGSNVVIFNNNSSQGKAIEKYLLEHEVNHVQYRIAPYAEMDDTQIREILQAADYIVGMHGFVGNRDILWTKYGGYFDRNKASVIEFNRIIKPEDILHLTEKVVEFNFNQVLFNTQSISFDLNAHIEEVTSSMEGIVDFLAETNGRILEADSQVKKQVNRIDETIEITKELNTNAQKIEELIDTIKMISDQTNLLALNAAIEAARAGDAGRGFAVVADEVKKLADKSKQSIQFIQQQVTNIRQTNNRTVPLLQFLASEITEMDEIINKILASSTVNQTEAQSISEALSRVTRISEQLTSEFVAFSF
ncbi:MAG: methyl-accepting chemotaxis protein [Desulfitobacterium sp.]